jgi:carbamoylphosphate synthase small subunit
LQQRGEVEDFVIDGQQFELVVNSAVKRGIALTEIQRDLQLLSTIQQLGPEAMANVNTQKLARKILRDGDMSPEAVRSESEVEELLQQAQQQQQAIQLQEAARAIAGQNPDPNTPA